MSSTLDQIKPAEIQAEKSIELSGNQPESSECKNQTDSLNTNDTNSISKTNEISPLKRDSSEITGANEEQTPAKSKKSRIDRFKEESEALLRSYGMKEGDSEKRSTRSRTRGTPVSTPIAKSKPEPKKQATGAKRGRKPAEKKNIAEESIKPTPKKGKGRTARKNIEHSDNGSDENVEEKSVENLSVEDAQLDKFEDQNDKSLNEESKNESKNELSESDQVCSTEKDEIKVKSYVNEESTANEESKPLTEPVVEKPKEQINLSNNSKNEINQTEPHLAEDDIKTVENNNISGKNTDDKKIDLVQKEAKKLVANDAKISTEVEKPKELQTV